MTDFGTYYVGVDVGYEGSVLPKQQAETWLRTVTLRAPEAGMRVRVIDSSLVLFELRADSAATGCAKAVAWLRAAIAAAPSRQLRVRQLSCKEVFGAESALEPDTENF